MIEVKIPADIQAYKSKLIFGLTTRQVISIGCSLVTCVPIGVYGKEYIPEDILPWIVILVAAPIIAWGFFYYKDMHFEEFMKFFLSHNLNPQKRVYEDTEHNIFHHINEEINEIEIVQQKIDNGELETVTKEWSEEK